MVVDEKARAAVKRYMCDGRDKEDESTLIVAKVSRFKSIYIALFHTIDFDEVICILGSENKLQPKITRRICT